MVLKRIGWILLIFLFTNIFFTDKEMRRLCLWLVFFVMLGIQSAFAQFVVKGTVVSKADNEPLIGVSIMQKGTTNGVVTDIDGNYELKIQGGDADLVFSYIGMRSQEFRVNARTGVLNVALEDDSQIMNEVIIRKSKFPQNPKRSVRFSGKRTKRSVQKRKARNTQKAETKVL